MAKGQFAYRKAGGAGHEPWFRLGSVDGTTTNIVTAALVAGLFVYAAIPSVWNPFFLNEKTLRQGQVWRLITWPFVVTPSIGMVFQIAVFWFLGNRIEELLGRRRFVVFIALLTVLPALVVMLLDLGGLYGDFPFHPIGIGTLGLALFFAYAIEYPGVKMFFGIPVWAMAAVYAAIEVLADLSRRDWVGLSLFFLTLALLATLMRAFGLATNLPVFPKFPLVGRIRHSRTPKRQDGKSVARPNRAGGRRQAPSDDTNTKTATVIPGPWPSGGIPQAEVDRLLEKIAKGGIDSLSNDERTLLDQASKNLRDRRS